MFLLKQKSSGFVCFKLSSYMSLTALEISSFGLVWSFYFPPSEMEDLGVVLRLALTSNFEREPQLL